MKSNKASASAIAIFSKGGALMLLAALIFTVTGKAFGAPGGPAASFMGVQSTVGTGWGLPFGPAVDTAGNLYVVDARNLQVVKISAATKVQTVILSGGLLDPFSVAVDHAGNVYVSDAGNRSIVEIPVGGSPRTLNVQGLEFPGSLAIDAAGNLLIGDVGLGKLVKVLANGAGQTTIGQGLVSPNWVTVDKAGNIYVADGGLGKVVEIPISGAAQTIIDVGTEVFGGIAVDDWGNIFFGDQQSYSVKEKFAGTNVISTLMTNIAVNSGGPEGVALDAAGRLYTSDSVGADNGEVREFQTRSIDFGNVAVCAGTGIKTKACGTSVTFNVSLLSGAGSTAQPLTLGVPNADYKLTATSCQAFNAIIYTCSYTVNFAPQFAGMRQGAFELTNGTGGQPLLTVPLLSIGTGAQAAFSPAHDTQIAVSGLQGPTGVAVDGSGNTYIASTAASITKVPANGGAPTTLGSGLTGSNYIALDGAGNLYAAGGQEGKVYRVDAVTGATTTIGSGIDVPTGIAVDAFSDVYVTDFYMGDVVEIPADGSPQFVVASGLGEPDGMTIDASGDLFIADYEDNKLFEIPAGFSAKTEIGSGWAGIADVAVDAAGDLFVLEYGVQQVFEVPAGGGAQRVVATVSGDPFAIALAPNGNMFITENGLFEVLRSQPPALSFAGTAVGSISVDSAQTVSVESVGNQSLGVTSVAVPTDFSLETSALGDASLCTSSSAIAPGSLCALPIAFTPQQTGALSEAVVVTDNAHGVTTAQSVNVSGTGLVPANSFTLSSSSLAFGSSQFGVAVTRTQTVTVKNGGGTSISISSVKLIDADATSFSMTSTCGTTLAPLSACTITVGFRPAAVGSLTAAIAITDNVAGSPQYITLSGTGTGVTTVALSTSSVAFSSVPINGKSAVKTVTLANTGAATLSIVSFVGEGTIASFSSSTTCGKTLAPKATCTISIQFAPKAVGGVKAAIEINDDATTAPQAIALSGSGTL